MDRRSYLIIFTVIIAVTGTVLFTDVLEIGGTAEIEEENQDWRQEISGKDTVNATLAGGCFWCTEAVFMGRPGVERAITGYAGGSKNNATYQKVLTGKTDHREAVRLQYYPSVISYEEILDIFWRSIDPTDGGGQFTDRGFQYTTAIYYHNGKQRKIAENSRENISGRFEKPVRTEILNFTTFFRAEDKHQNYSERRKASYELYKRGSGRKSRLSDLWGENPFQ